MKRSRRGEGTFRQRPDGRYEWRDPRNQKSYYSKSERALIAKKNEVLGIEIASKESGKITVSGLLKDWLRHVGTKIRPNTLATYSWTCEKYITPYIGKIRLHKLTPMDCQLMIDSAPKGSRGHVKTLIRMALAWALNMELVRKNAAAQCSIPKRNRASNIKPFDEAEMKLYTDACATDPHGALWLLAIGCGARLGEIRGLMWADVDLKGAEIHIRRTLQPCGVLEPKSDGSRRTVQVPSRVVAALKDWAIACGDRTGYVFPFEKRKLEKLFGKFLKSAGIAHHRFHDTRHSYATHALNAGVDVKLVSEQLGHASVSFTLSTYAHVLKSREKDAAAAMNKILGG